MNLRNKKNFKAFTLIELLVVIAIISLLVSILLPSLQKAKDFAKKAACMANLKAVGAAFYFYLEEYNEICPTARPTTTPPDYTCWISLISGVISYPVANEPQPSEPPWLSKETFICPSMPEGGSQYINCYDWSPWINVGYTYNYTISNRNANFCPQPSDTPLLFDGRGLYASGFYGYADWARFSQPYRHENSGLNFLFIDSHVSFFENSEIELSLQDDFTWEW